jgi:hypothetical protein
MRQAFFIVILLLWVFLAVGSSARDIVPASVPFKVGEKLTFVIRYGFIKAGVATMEVKEIVDYGDNQCYRITSEARSTMPFSLVFEARDSVVSFMDVEHLFTWRFEKHLKEGNHIKDDVVIFDQQDHTATYLDSSVIAVPPEVQDVLSSLYFLRTRNLEVGKTILIENHSDKKNYPLEVKILRNETVSVPAGKFDCVVVEPILKASGLFQHQGRLTVWLTKDSRLMPVMMKGRIIIGSIEAALAKMAPGGS